MSYARIVNFGPSVEKSPNNNPLTYCMTTSLDNSFVHTSGERLGPSSKACAMFMSDYCAQDWNGICEVASRNTNNHYPNTVMRCNKGNNGACLGTGLGNQFTQGEILVRNTAAKKYLSKMSSNCALRYEPFDPMVPTSPMISYWDSSGSLRSECTPMYEIDPSTIDEDPVMNKLLSKPVIALDILLNIHNTAKRLGKLDELRHTKLGKFFQTKGFQAYKIASAHRAEMRSYV
jgi:hypothetical protein